MKKVMNFIILVAMLFTLSGCGEQYQNVDSTAGQGQYEEIIDQTQSKGSEEAQGPEGLESSQSIEIDTPAPPEGSSFEIRFLDVGQADAALILCDGQVMLIDGGNVADSSLIVAVLKKLDIQHIDYIVDTHAHEDHVGGLSGALNACTVDHVLAPQTSYDSKAFSNFKRYTEAQGKQIEVPKPGDSFQVGNSYVEVLGPTQNYSETNNTSLVLKVEYGDTSFLFTGDMERDAEQDLIDYWGEKKLDADLLKVGHHGSETSTSYTFLRCVMPEHGIISVGKDNSYGHPDDSVLSRLRDADVKVYRTDLQGDIVVHSDGTTLIVEVDRNKDIETNPTNSQSNHQTSEEINPTVGNYIGNINSKKFHLPSCHTLPAEKNQIYFDTREEAIDNGYSPCGNCNP